MNVCKLTKAQRQALSDYCKEFGYAKKEIVKALKESGAIANNATSEDLGDYTNGDSYDDMLSFLSDNL